MPRMLSVALVQLEARELADHERAWSDLVGAIDDAASQGPDLIVLPEASYPAYFLHSRERYQSSGIYPDQQLLDSLSERSRTHGVHIAVGLVLHNASGGLENTCVIFDPTGRQIARYAKHFLWHFDRNWFEPGDELPLVDLEIDDSTTARAGILICSDSRLEEISRGYAQAGAELIINPTAWVTAGRDPARLSNPQVEFLMPTRAIESGAWIVSADKAGSEAKSVVYAGQSGVVSPAGIWTVRAPSASAGIVLHSLDLDGAVGPPVERRADFYDELDIPIEDSEAVRIARVPLIAEDAAARVAAAAIDALPSAVDLIEGARELVGAATVQDAALIVFPDLAGSDPRAITASECLPLLQALAAEYSTIIAAVMAERTDGQTFKTQYLITPFGVSARHRQTHLSRAEQQAGFSAGDTPPPVVETLIGRVGLLSGVEGLVPELPRALKLQGAEVLAWSAGKIGAPLRLVARARALEHHYYVVASGDCRETGGGYVVAPAGTVLTETLPGRRMVMTADMNRLLARWNDMAPRTNPLRDRTTLNVVVDHRSAEPADATGGGIDI